MFFSDLTNTNLQIKSFNSIKNDIHKTFAVELVSMSSNMNEFCKQLMIERTKYKHVSIHKNNKMGIEIILILEKPSGYIEIYLRKKRSAEIKVIFVNYLDFTITQQFKFHNDCNIVWVKTLLFQFDDIIVNYIINGFSNKTKNIFKLIILLLNNNIYIVNVHIDIPGYILII